MRSRPALEAGQTGSWPEWSQSYQKPAGPEVGQTRSWQDQKPARPGASQTRKVLYDSRQAAGQYLAGSKSAKDKTDGLVVEASIDFAASKTLPIGSKNRFMSKTILFHKKLDFCFMWARNWYING